MVLGEEVIRRGRTRELHIQEAFAAGNAEGGEVPEAGLQFGGVAFGDFGEAEAFPGPEVDLPELRDGLGC